MCNDRRARIVPRQEAGYQKEHQHALLQLPQTPAPSPGLEKDGGLWMIPLQRVPANE